MNFYSFYPLSFPFFSFLCIKVTRETFNDVITRTWRPFRIVIRFFTIKDRSDVRSSGSSSPDTIATLPLSSCSAIIHARDLKDSLKDQRSSHFFHCVWFWKKRRIKSIDSFEYEILWYSVKIWRLKKKKKSKTNPTRKTGREKFRTAFRFLFLFFFLNTNGRARRAPLVSLWFEETWVKKTNVARRGVAWRLLKVHRFGFS